MDISGTFVFDCVIFTLTDLPSVLSGHQLFTIDPEEKYFTYKNEKTSGYSWNLKHKKKVKDSRDHFLPFVGILGCTDDLFEQCYYRGTMFRFPLRSEVSLLCDTVYNSTKVTKLLESFESDAHLILLFLKKLESIEIYTRGNGSNDAKLLFRVNIADDCLEEVRTKRAMFLEKCQAESQLAIKVSYRMSIDILNYKGGSTPEKSHHHWLVIENRAGREQLSTKFQQLCTNDKLSSIPLAGTAMSLQRVEGPDHLVTTGQVFCHLPLSGEQRCPTGLPVHVNGYFAISQNRRHLKWPTPNYKPGSDESVDWNQCLLSELLPTTYRDLIKTSTEIFDNANDEQSLTPAMIYAALPNLASVDEKWRPTADVLYRSLLDTPFLYTRARGGQWVCVKDSIVIKLTGMSHTMTYLIMEVLIRCDVNIVGLPEHLHQALMHYCPDVSTVNPSTLRTIIRSQPESYRDRTWNDKLIFLEYLLSDEKYQQLEGRLQYVKHTQVLMYYKYYCIYSFQSIFSTKSDDNYFYISPN